MPDGAGVAVASGIGTPAGHSASPQIRRLAVVRAGHLVPAGDFDATVHSVFARACNIALGKSLLTLVAAPAADGPTTLVLGSAVPDLRTLFRRGEPIVRRGRHLRAERVALELRGATVWRPAPLARRVARATVARRLRSMAAMRHPGSRHRMPGSGPLREIALARACRDLVALRACRLAAGMIGLGAGLTPAGDDYLVGLCAGLEAGAGRAARPGRFLARLRAQLAASCGRTTPIGAHFLALAARRQFGADLLDARAALVGASLPAARRAALDRLLRVGATSGPAAGAGLHAGLAAWLATARASPGAGSR